jgi:RimJ/RimL family protein N-acetyltransferase
MSNAFFQGRLVRLSSEDPLVMAEAFARWNQDSEYFRLLDSDPAHLWSAKKMKEWFEKDLDSALPNNLLFSIRTLAEDKLIGFIAFDGLNWTNRDTFVAIGIGEQDYWSKGYGSDAMRVMLRYGFTELNLHRISLTVFEQNPRGIRSYEKCGFKLEGRIRDFLLRDGQRSDMLHMGILHSEWDSLEQEWNKI